MPEDEQIFAYFRKTDKETWLVAANMSEEEVSADSLKALVKSASDVKIANYPDRVNLDAKLRPYEAFMMKVSV